MELPKWADRVIKVAWESLQLFSLAQGLSWGGAVGLYLFLSVPPLMVASTIVAKAVVLEQEAEAFMVQQAAKFVPARSELFESVFAADPGGSATAIGVSLVLLLFSGSRAFAALGSGVNVMWRQSQQVTFWERQFMRTWMLGAAIGLLALGALLELGVSFLFGVDPIGGDNGSRQLWLIDWQLIPSLLLGLFLLIAYKTLPESKVPWNRAAIGAVIATIGVRIAQAVMGYMSEAGTFRTPYGDLAGVALMATWALVVGVIVLFGATVVAVLSGRLEEMRRDGADPLQG